MIQQQKQAESEAQMQQIQINAQVEAKKIELETQAKLAIIQAEHQNNMTLAKMKLQVSQEEKGVEFEMRKNIEGQKDDRKDDRVKKQAVQQSKLISQRQGDAAPLKEEEGTDVLGMLQMMQSNV